MYKRLFSLFLSLWVLGACQNESGSAEPATSASVQAETTSTAEASSTEKTPQELLLGRWVMPADPDTGFEPWSFFDAEKSYSDGNEEGTPYAIEGDKITYKSEYGEHTNRIVELTPSRFVEETEDGTRTEWTKADPE